MFPRRYFGARYFAPRYWHAASRQGDALRWYLTGAASDGGAQADPAASLGGYRSSTEANRVGILTTFAINGLTIGQASRANGTDGSSGAVNVAAGNRLRYVGPDGSGGPISPLANGETWTLRDGTDPNKWVRATRASASNLVGAAGFEFEELFNSPFTLEDAAEAEQAAGSDKYRALMFRNADAGPMRNVTLYVATLGTTAVSSAAQLGGSGAGTIQGSASAFADWPWQGWCRIQEANGTLREIVYYSSRTNSTLTVPSLGRGRLGTSAAAGASDDNLYPVPGIRIAHEAADPLDSGDVQTIADEDTAPTGVTWSTAITLATGISVGQLTTGEQGALWIHRELPAGVSPIAANEIEIVASYMAEARTYTERLGGIHRIADDDSDRWELHVGTDAEPDLTAAPTYTYAVTDASDPEADLPLTVPALTPGHVYYFVLNLRNRHGLVSRNITSTRLEIDGAGAEIANPPSSPDVLEWSAQAGGTFRLRAVYAYGADGDDQADTWAYWITYDGSAPDPSGTATGTEAMIKVDGAAYLEVTTGAQAHGTTGKVIVRTRRSSDTIDSTNVDVHTATASTAGPSSPTGGIHFRGVAEQMQ